MATKRKTRATKADAETFTKAEGQREARDREYAEYRAWEIRAVERSGTHAAVVALSAKRLSDEMDKVVETLIPNKYGYRSSFPPSITEIERARAQLERVVVEMGHVTKRPSR